MQRFILGTFAVVVLILQTAGFTQSKQPPVLATDITAAEVKAVLDAPPLSDVTRLDTDRGLDRGRGLLQPVSPPRDEREGCALARRAQGDRAPDPGARAGDDDVLADETVL